MTCPICMRPITSEHRLECLCPRCHDCRKLLPEALGCVTPLRRAALSCVIAEYRLGCGCARCDCGALLEDCRCGMEHGTVGWPEAMEK